MKMGVFLCKGIGVGIVLSESVCLLLSSGIGFNADPGWSSLLSIISMYTVFHKIRGGGSYVSARTTEFKLIIGGSVFLRTRFLSSCTIIRGINNLVDWEVDRFVSFYSLP